MSEIYAALAKVMAEVDHVAKRDRNEHQRFLFRGIDAVVNAVGPVLRKHQVVVVPTVQSVTYDVVSTSTGKPASACRVVVDYTFYATDGSSIVTKVAAEAWDNGDKAAPKAMSVAFRTALLQALALPTDEPDPDTQTYERDNTPRQQPAADSTPMQPKTRANLFALFGQKGPTERDAQLAGINAICGTAYTSRSHLTDAHAQQVIAALRKRPDLTPAEVPA
jgi:hypothetical protein